MALGVLGGVEKQAEHGGRQPRAAHTPRLAERAGVGAAQLVERAFDLRLEERHQLLPAGRLGRLLGDERRALLRAQRLAARVGEQAVACRT